MIKNIIFDLGNVIVQNPNINTVRQFFEKEKDMDLYHYFLPRIQEFLFQNFTYHKEKIRKFEEFDQPTKATILSKYPVTMFEYDLKSDMQGKAGEEEGIFFHMQKMQFICFRTGICFLVMKTNIEDSKDFESYGTSPSFPVPDKLVEDIIDTDLSQVMNKIFTKDDERHNKGGGIQLLTHGKISRIDLTQMAFIMALTKYINKNWN